MPSFSYINYLPQNLPLACQLPLWCPEPCLRQTSPPAFSWTGTQGWPNNNPKGKWADPPQWQAAEHQQKSPGLKVIRAQEVIPQAIHVPFRLPVSGLCPYHPRKVQDLGAQQQSRRPGGTGAPSQQAHCASSVAALLGMAPGRPVEITKGKKPSGALFFAVLPF